MSKDMVKGSILIVDDSEMNRAILSDILGEDYEIIEARDGLEAIDILSQRADSISLVLLDIVMPRMDGFSVLAKINESNWISKIPVIIISSENASLYVERAYDLGALDYIQRPFDTLVVRRRALNTIMLYGRQKSLNGTDEDLLLQNISDQADVISILTNLLNFGKAVNCYRTQNIQAISEAILNSLGGVSFKYKLTQADINCISTASTLCDIGLSLMKKNDLLDENSDEYKNHTLSGAKILSKMANKESPLLKRAIEICRYHHERWDGKGYPEGLKGDQIPISAQVVSVAETYEFLTDKNINKDAVTHDEAISKIMNGECGAFNPVLMIVLKSVADTLPAKLK